MFKVDGEGREYACLNYNEYDQNHSNIIDVKAAKADKRMYSQPREDDCPVISQKLYI